MGRIKLGHYPRRGLNEMSLAVYELVDRARNDFRGASIRWWPPGKRSSYDADFDPVIRNVATKVGTVMEWGRSIVDWQDNDEVQRQMRRDIKRELRDAGGLSDDQLNELVGSMIEVARRSATR